MLQLQLLLLPLLEPELPPLFSPPPPPLLADEHPMPHARKHSVIGTAKLRSVEPRREEELVLRER